MYTVLKFSATWCGPCQELNKILFEHDYQCAGHKIKSYDVDDDERIADTFGISCVPTILIVKDKHVEVARHEGFMTYNDLEEFINKHTNE